MLEVHIYSGYEGITVPSPLIRRVAVARKNATGKVFVEAGDNTHSASEELINVLFPLTYLSALPTIEARLMSDGRWSVGSYFAWGLLPLPQLPIRHICFGDIAVSSSSSHLAEDVNNISGIASACSLSKK